MADQREVVLVVVRGERDPGRAVEDRVEQRVAVGVTSAPNGLGIDHRRLLGQPPQRSRSRQTVWQRWSEGFVQHVGEQLLQGWVADNRPEKRLGVGLAP